MVILKSSCGILGFFSSPDAYSGIWGGVGEPVLWVSFACPMICVCVCGGGSGEMVNLFFPSLFLLMCF